MFRVVVRPESVVVETIEDAASVLLAASAADPSVTYMPYVVNEDGSRLSSENVDALDRAMDAAE